MALGKTEVLGLSTTLIFQHDYDPLHCTIEVQKYLGIKSSQPWIWSRQTVLQTPKFTKDTPSDFFFGVARQNNAFPVLEQSLPNVKDRINQETDYTHSKNLKSARKAQKREYTLSYDLMQDILIDGISE